MTRIKLVHAHTETDITCFYYIIRISHKSYNKVEEFVIVTVSDYPAQNNRTLNFIMQSFSGGLRFATHSMHCYRSSLPTVSYSHQNYIYLLTTP